MAFYIVKLGLFHRAGFILNFLESTDRPTSTCSHTRHIFLAGSVLDLDAEQGVSRFALWIAGIDVANGRRSISLEQRCHLECSVFGSTMYEVVVARNDGVVIW